MRCRRVRPRLVRRAVLRRDLLATSLPWRALAYLLSGAAVGAVALALLLVMLVGGAVLTLVLVGIPVLAAMALIGLPFAAVERRRLRLIDPEPAASPHRVPPPGLRAWIRARLGEQATWRALAYTVLMAAVLWPVELVAVTYGLIVPLVMICAPFSMTEAGPLVLLKFWPLETYPEAFLAAGLGVVGLLLAAYPLTALAVAHAGLARLLLTPRGGEPGERLAELTRSRTRLVEAFEIERRRIERDLHDGAQQRLIALAMTLGLAKVSRGEEMAELVTKAHDEAKLVLAEIRDLIRGIHPRILVDRGLPAAMADVADRSPVPVEVEVDIPHRLPEAVESVAYFVVSEGLANVARHSGAGNARIRAGLGEFHGPELHEPGEFYELGGHRLTIEITDDGVGGADPSAGSGLAGLADRVSAVDGRLMLSSPAGGPTLLRVEIPCTPIDH
ncbi:sensor histidine kinase [Microbispora oryzae]|uniref:sensor histidine kinase n=1 Tax=Microbispora oryzae TaxID=2806554 RepID=UPI0027DD23FC|nr:sensor domain-containing protein [Microbispora oryzae]